MKLNKLKRAPIFIAAGVIGLVCAAQIWWPGIFERQERMTYDWRARQGVNNAPIIATNLGFVSISDDTITAVGQGLVRNTHYGLKWPRHIYGRVARELANQGAKAVAFDILFAELRPDHSPIPMEGQALPMESDDFFAMQIKQAGNVILAAEQQITPPPLFRNAALALGDITADKDFDGILRRTKAFRTYRKWHPLFRHIEQDPEYGVDLNKAWVETNQIILPRVDGEPIKIALDKDGNFDFGGPDTPPGKARYVKPFTDERIWHMGIVLAAQQLKLDLANALVELDKGRITFAGADGVKRVLPVDKDGYFYINWCLNTGRKDLTQEPFEGLLAQYQARMSDFTNNPLVAILSQRWDAKKVDWHDKLVVVGSTAVGNDLTDMGATPLSKNTFLASEHWNVANSILTGQFIRRSSLPMSLGLIIVLGAIAAWLTLTLRSYVALFWVLMAATAYVAIATWIYIRFRYWLPIVAPVVGGQIVNYGILLVYLVVFEQKERRKLRTTFAKMVPPDVVTELEEMEVKKLALSGGRRNVTVLFADIRGFTELTDVSREKAEEYIQEHHLTGNEAEAVRDAQAKDTLDTVNMYLTIVAETVLKHKGTVDKFIGDCVMAFWGAPIANPKHALCCVQAAIEAQRTIYQVNQEREAENRRREAENLKLVAEGRPPLPMLPTLVLGSGINTGVVTVGMMGSEQRLNYTAFGRDVNLASRLESVSGRGRIIISEATLAEMIQDDPTLALSCKELPPEKVKGFRVAIKIYEVPWRESNVGAPTGETTHIYSAEDNTGYFTARGGEKG